MKQFPTAHPFALATSLVLLTTLPLATAAPGIPQLVPPDPAKQLVLDNRVIQSVAGARLVLGTVEKEPRNPLFRADQPWENSLNNLYPNILWDAPDQQFKLWYKCVLHDRDVIARMANPTTIHEQGWFLLYAASRDGLRWTKPNLGQFVFDGSPANNAVTRDTPNAGVFRDPHDPDPARRFKMVYDIGLGKPRVRFSPDGLRWTEPFVPNGFSSYHCDTHNNAFWDNRLGKYVWFTKAYLGERLVARLESENFLDWQSSGVVLRSSLAEGKSRQTYCLPVFPYANLYLGYLMMYDLARGQTVDCELAWSPDSIQWHRLAPGTPLIPRGPAGSFDSECIYGPSGPPVAQDGKLLIYYGGSDSPHKGWKRHCLPALARLRLDGFAGYEPIERNHPATVTTHPMLCTGPLQITADVQGGAITARILDVPAFASATAHPVTADCTDAELRWTGGNPAELRGKMIRLQFELRAARLYAIRGVELAPAPVASTGVRHFTNQLPVVLRPSIPAADVIIRYTLDGSTPTSTSTAAAAPLHLAQTTRLRARVFLPGVANGGPEFDETFTLRPPTRATWPTPMTQTITFDRADHGWKATEQLVHQPTGGARGGFITASRAGGLRPFAYLPAAATNTLAGNWPKKFGGNGANIAFHVRAPQPGGHPGLELFAGEIAQWSFRSLPVFRSEWTRVATTIRWDWNDAEAEAAGWTRALNGFSWAETVRNLGRVVVISGPSSQHTSFDLDEFTVETHHD